MTEPMIANKGLAGLIADDSSVSKVDVELNKLIYYGYDINELCEKADFMQTAYLLFYGKLPTTSQLEEFEDFEKKNREIPATLLAFFKTIPKYSHPMDYVKLGVNYIALLDKDNKLGENSHEQNLKKALNLFAKLPSIIANGYRMIHGMEPVLPDPDLSYSANFISMIQGDLVDDPLKIEVFDRSLILYAEHGFNASTFAFRAI